MFMSKTEFIRVPRGIRNNNPLNLKISSSNWKGKCGSDGVFEKFTDASFGFRAAYKNIKTWIRRKPHLTLKQLIFLWCPDSTNQSYCKSVLKLSCIPPCIALYNLSINDFVSLLRAMCIVENGYCPYSIEFIKKSILIK